ncbi:MAG: type I DNA topoisomerase [Thermotogota bacterium]|nr:type I DNA topoisomerase [Thermotogota bacterium]
MTKKLVIVESPAKAKTISRYLGKDYEVASSKGHVRDLPNSKFGVDLKTFEPTYEVVKNKKKVVSELKKKAKNKNVLLASDMDREGEAIAWHLSELLSLPKDEKNRIIFNEITKNAILDAVKEPQKIDNNKVDAQVARRILDRIVGYKLSPLLWKVIKGGLSAGRVQSVALKMIVELDKKIFHFKPHTYYKIFMKYADEKIPLDRINGKKFGKKSVNSEKEKDELLEELKAKEYYISSVKKSKSRRKPPNPFITSTLQQSSINELGWSASKTMRVAQQLYEGIETPEGNIAFITYMRTDSIRVSEVAKNTARKFIKENYGNEYIGTKKERKQKGKNIQDAHESIRPTYVDRSPKEIKKRKLIKGDHYRLYKLIWDRFIASQMTDSVYEITKVEIADIEKKYIFLHTFEKQVFPGHEIISKKNKTSSSKEMEAKKDKRIVPDGFLGEKTQTKPPSRYSEATLVKNLEKKGIGRPSTYATIISTLLTRNYVNKAGRELRPTLLGSVVSDFLIKEFPDIIDEDFTARLESELDEIENANLQWKKSIEGFFNSFSKDLNEVQESMSKGKIKLEYSTDVKCDCGGKFKLVFGRYGGYLKCEECEEKKSIDMNIFAPIDDHTVILHDVLKEYEEDAKLDEKCPKCGAPLVKKRGRYGEFIACSAYPKCKYTRNVRAEGPCPECGGIVEKMRSKKGKTYFKCTSCGKMYWNEPSKEECPQCGGTLFKRKRKDGSVTYYCPKCKKRFSSNDLKGENHE